MNKSSNVFLIIIIAMIFGLLAGFLSLIILVANNFSLPFFGKISLINDNVDKQIVIEQPKNVIVQEEMQIKQIENNLLPSLINIYPSKSSSAVLGKAYTIADLKGEGVVLTADGWIITAKSVVSDQKGKYSAVGYQSRIYALDDFIGDDASGIVFGRLAGASNLTVATIANDKELILGQRVAVIKNRNEVDLTNIKKIGYKIKNSQDLIFSSESLNKEIFLDMDLDDNYNGAAVVNLKGELVGIVDSGRVIMAHYFKNIINDVLNKKKISRPVLGVKYIDLAQAEGLFDLGDKGAYIYAAPAKNSPAWGKLKEGDIIKKVNDQELNVYSGLTEALLDYQTGDKVELIITRAGKEESVEVVLK